jgi:hypothetical protein
LVDKRVLLPAMWFPEAYAARRARGKSSLEVTGQSKPQLAAMRLPAIAQAGLLPCKAVVAACLDGQSPTGGTPWTPGAV